MESPFESFFRRGAARTRFMAGSGPDEAAVGPWIWAEAILLDRLNCLVKSKKGEQEGWQRSEKKKKRSGGERSA